MTPFESLGASASRVLRRHVVRRWPAEGARALAGFEMFGILTPPRRERCRFGRRLEPKPGVTSLKVLLEETNERRAQQEGQAKVQRWSRCLKLPKALWTARLAD